jgi:hypothetical protein
MAKREPYPYEDENYHFDRNILKKAILAEQREKLSENHYSKDLRDLVDSLLTLDQKVRPTIE